MTRQINLADTQGNIVRAYGLSFSSARFYFLKFSDSTTGRSFVDAIRQNVMTAAPWRSSKTAAAKCDSPDGVLREKPNLALNIAFSYPGLEALGLPTRTLTRLPEEFIDGMGKRAMILGDQELSPATLQGTPRKWDTIWRNTDSRPHAIISLYVQLNDDGTPKPELDAESAALIDLCEHHRVDIVSGHGPGNDTYQEAHLPTLPLKGKVVPIPKEHFGFTDGFGDAYFEGQDPCSDPSDVIGRGKITDKGEWAPLATGEFLLGHPDEAQEIPTAAMPRTFSRNGTFLVWRKLHQNVSAFRKYIAKTAKVYAKLMDIDEADAAELIKAKMVGRWSNGVPLMKAPTLEAWKNFPAKPTDPVYRDFKYGHGEERDLEGEKCPVTAHIRRANTRDMLGPGESSALNNKRRLLRRGLPYGSSDGVTDDRGEHGVIFMAYCASLFRQFEFVQQQWLQYGLDFNAGNDTCPLVGNHDNGNAKFVIPSPRGTGKPPFICANLPQFVETRGGDYYFVPSMTALRMIAMGTVDPT